MSVWDDVVGQPDIVKTLKSAVASATSTQLEGESDRAMTHAWLFTGPPGSGRSTAARAFAAALLSPDQGAGDSADARQVMAGTHADLTVVATEKTLIAIDEVRQLVGQAQRSPSGGRFRIILIEDADRMAERTSNVLLKAIEEPPERTVWLLCAPSPGDVITTIRSRCRTLSLRIPPAQAVEDLLVARHGIDRNLAGWAAAAAQNHIGRARYLATDEGARADRQGVLELPMKISGVGDAVRAAAAMVADATDQAKLATEERNGRERAELLQMLGVEAGKTIPPALRAQVRQLEENQKRRETRAKVDQLDRALLDLLSLYRDILLSQVAPGSEPINRGSEEAIATLASGSDATATMRRIDVIQDARRRLRTNMAPLLCIEAMVLGLRR